MSARARDDYPIEEFDRGVARGWNRMCDEIDRLRALEKRRAAEEAAPSRCGECGGTLFEHRCVDCHTLHNAPAQGAA